MLSSLLLAFGTFLMVAMVIQGLSIALPALYNLILNIIVEITFAIQKLIKKTKV